MIIVAGLVVAAPVALTVGTVSASDNYGAWSWPASDYPVNWPGECLVAGTTLIAGSPFKHNFSAANSCHSNLSVVSYEALYDSGGSVVHYCESDLSQNWAECQVDVTTPSGDYWGWRAQLYYGNDIYGFECNGSTTDFARCWQQGDGTVY
jgi:hypothetical protein